MRCHSRQATNSPGMACRSLRTSANVCAGGSFIESTFRLTTTDLQVVTVALDARIAHEVVDVSVVPQRGRVDHGFVVIHQFSEEPKCLRLRQLREPEVVELNLEGVCLVMQRGDRPFEVFVEKA